MKDGGEKVELGEYKKEEGEEQDDTKAVEEGR